jgi:hypothetical protein
MKIHTPNEAIGPIVKKHCTLHNKEVEYNSSCLDYEFKGFGITIGINVCTNCTKAIDKEGEDAFTGPKQD